MKPVLFLSALIGLAACDSGVETRKEAVPPAEQQSTIPAAATPTPGPAPAVTAPGLSAAGPAVTLRPEADGSVEGAASVVRLDPLTAKANGSAKLFGTAGGDPAMNGLYTYLAFYQSPADGWRVFKLGDFVDYRRLSDAPGRIELEIDESTHDAATGTIGGRTRRVIVGWSVTSDGAAPAAVTVTPAR